ncbi:type II secretion system protein N [Sphingomonas sp. LHG3406-1]|uniref:type II secretion system protein N n=1 Tax=Sphingomonas sp. LHG3406-1 TaxID=2804617 RepID=UPI00260247B7|nr:type II secretion system protein N [Sphingomonas sp. LHG3406-1]
MNRRWAVWTSGIALLAALLMLPLRVALPASDLQQLGLSARQVGGSIWYGRIGELMLGRQLLGTFDVRLDPGALLLGRIAMPFERLDAVQGPLTGVLRAGGSLRGVERLNGSLPAANLLGGAPVDAISFTNATILFEDGRCSEATGQIAANLAVRFGPLALDRGFRGALACEGERVRARLASDAGTERLEFFVSNEGRVRGWITIRSPLPGLDTILSTYGFRTSPDGLTLPFETRL